MHFIAGCRYECRFDFEGVDVEARYRWGEPSHVVLDTAEDFEYDLIVIGAKGQSDLQYLLMGSAAEKFSVMHHVHCAQLSFQISH